jgi:hypothetical protein
MKSFESKQERFKQNKSKFEKNKLFLNKLYIFIGFISIFGYVLNIFKIFSIGFEEMTFLMIVRLSGILLFPIGVVLGYY